MTILLNIIWALWHLPFFLFGGMGHTNVFVSYILFVVITMELGIILNYIRIKTNSVFGAILLHPIPNIILMIVTGFTTVENEFWASHPNIIGIILLFPFAFYYYRKGKTLYYELE